MEEKVKKASKRPEVKQEKLTYEQLESYAQQVTAKAQEVYKENQALKQALGQATLNNNFREIECVLKCLDHADLFSPEFIAKVTGKLEEVLVPEEKEESDTKEEE